MEQNNESIFRRSANYKPSSWDFNSIQSLSSDFLEADCASKIEQLKLEVLDLLRRDVQFVQKLELIDTLQLLGLEHHYDEEIKIFLADHNRNEDLIKIEDLYAAALYFKLLRLHGTNISQDLFKKFLDENGENYKEELLEDVKGMLSLYEASQLGAHGECLMEKAKLVCTANLETLLKKDGDLVECLREELEYSTKNPFHKTFPWLQIRLYIERYERSSNNIEPCLLTMAQLNFNMEQAKHIEELKSVSRWWNRVGLGEKLDFVRDRCVEAYFMSLATIPEVEHGKSRKMLAKPYLLITSLDDVYDIYGTIDELENFTDAIERWDIDSSGDLPEFMKICLLALFSTTEEFANSTHNNDGINITFYLSKRWGEMCKTFLTEAKWLNKKYTPSYQEYMNNGRVSSSAALILVHAFCFLSQNITLEDMEHLANDPEPIFCSQTIFRLCNDLMTSKEEAKRGDAPCSVQCYVNETGMTEEKAENYMKGLVDEAWKKILKEFVSPFSSSPKLLGSLAMSLSRTVQAAYQFGDGYGAPDEEIKRQVMLVLLQPLRSEQQLI